MNVRWKTSLIPWRGVACAWRVAGLVVVVVVCRGENQEDDGNTDKVMRLLVQVSSGWFRQQLTPLTQLIRG